MRTQDDPPAVDAIVLLDEHAVAYPRTMTEVNERETGSFKR